MRIGHSIYERDRAAEKTTDVLFPDGDSHRPSGNSGGWLINEIGDHAYRVRYLVDQLGVPKAYAEASYSALSDSVFDARRLDPLQAIAISDLAQYKAIQTAADADFLRCSERYNSVSIPSGDGVASTIHVYLMPARFDTQAVPLGGFQDFTISDDGTTILDHFSQTKSCVGDGHRHEAETGRRVSLMVSHLTSPTPTAFHVFANLNYGLPVYVATSGNHMLWYVADGKIGLLETRVGK